MHTRHVRARARRLPHIYAVEQPRDRVSRAGPNTELWRGATASRTSRVRGHSVSGDARSAVLASRNSCHEPRSTRIRRRTGPRWQGCRSHGTVLVDGDDHVHRHGEVGTRGLRHRISCGDAAGARDRRCRMRARRTAGLLVCCLMTRRVGVLLVMACKVFYPSLSCVLRALRKPTQFPHAPWPGACGFRPGSQGSRDARAGEG